MPVPEKKIDDAILRRMWAAGDKASDIAEIFGVTTQTLLSRVSKLRRDFPDSHELPYRSTPLGGTRGRIMGCNAPAIYDADEEQVTQESYNALVDAYNKLRRKLAKQ